MSHEERLRAAGAAIDADYAALELANNAAHERINDQGARIIAHDQALEAADRRLGAAESSIAALEAGGGTGGGDGGGGGDTGDPGGGDGGGDDPEPPDAPQYGAREGIRPVDSAPYLAGLPAWDGAGYPFDQNGGGRTIPRSALPYWWGTQGETNGRGLYNLTIDGRDDSRQVAVYAARLRPTSDGSPAFELVDVKIRGFAQPGDEDRSHVAVIDGGFNARSRAINLEIEDAGETGLELRGEIRGGHIRAREVAYGGNPGAGDVIEDLILEWIDNPSDPPNEWHWGAMKAGGGGAVGAVYRRVIFRNGCAWTDLGASASYIDCVFEDSPGWGIHHEIDKWYDADVPPLVASHCTFRRNTRDRAFGNHHWFNWPGTGRLVGGSGNPSHVQHGHITAHMGQVHIDHALVLLDVTTEVGYAEWTDGRAGQAPSGVRQNSAGSVIRDSLFIIQTSSERERHGLIACMANPSHTDWRNVTFAMDRETAQQRLFIVRESDGWKRLTPAEFISRYAPTCRVELTA